MEMSLVRYGAVRDGLVCLIFACCLTACSSVSSHLSKSVDASPYRAELQKGVDARAVSPIGVFPVRIAGGKGLDPALAADFSEKLRRRLAAELPSEAFENPARSALRQRALENVLESRLPSHRQAALFGELTGVSSVVYGTINRFGTDASRDMRDLAGASAGFSLWLIEAGSGRILWQCNYTNFNQPLSENLLRIQESAAQGFRYRSSPELLNYGLEKVVADLRLIVSPKGVTE
ncbi:MAG: hypothetical protein PHC51_08075 [bacterium]|nr:hypothetical protein [bacterium]